jgi:glycosyltransferase involved in cell wall biosynthesis
LGQLVLWAHKHGKKVVYTVANELGCHKKLSHLTSVRDREMYKYGLHRADKIIVQTNKQKDLIKSEFGLESTVIPMPSKGYKAETVTSEQRLSQANPRILWVGRIDKVKRPNWLLDIAASFPQIAFDIIGAENTPSPYGLDISKRANELPNVTMHGRVQHDDMGKFYKHASLLCSTSKHEGFPNVYLEAWSTGLPIVSTFDPDSVIEKHNMGIIAKDRESLIEAIETLLKPTEHAKASEAALRYFNQNHALDASMEKFSEAFKEVL